MVLTGIITRIVFSTKLVSSFVVFESGQFSSPFRKSFSPVALLGGTLSRKRAALEHIQGAVGVKMFCDSLLWAVLYQRTLQLPSNAQATAQFRLLAASTSHTSCGSTCSAWSISEKANAVFFTISWEFRFGMKHLSNGSLLFPLELSTSWWMGMERGYASASTWRYEIICFSILSKEKQKLSPLPVPWWWQTYCISY